MDNYAKDVEFISAINENINEKIPFNRLLGLKVDSISYEHVKVSFQMRDELMGNYKREMLHGGVISTVIDFTGGLCAFMDIQQRMTGKSLKAKLEKFGKVSTIDVRIDFLRPGIGKWFVATAYVLRMGKKIAVTRIELHNDQNGLIAVGTGSYFVS